jgi:hypothetical protein
MKQPTTVIAPRLACIRPCNMAKASAAMDKIATIVPNGPIAMFNSQLIADTIDGLKVYCASTTKFLIYKINNRYITVHYKHIGIA